ncbi:MAG: ATP-binding protein [Myxococcales bacterium]|nr:ATP-binding protein [Myxococcales bacterium]MBP6842372.1 ATP-binding protein [Kofleriaceae bacterium]
MRPYTDASEHLADQLAAVRVALRLAARRRSGADAAELARLAERRARIEGESAARAAVSELALVPLERVRRTFRLSPTEVGVLVLLTAIEVDVRLHGLAVALMKDAARGHVDVGFLGEVLYADARQRLPFELGADGALVRFGLVQLDGGAPVFTLGRPRVAARVVDLLHGRDRLERGLARVVEPIAPLPAEALVVTEGQLVELAGLVGAAIERPGHPVLVMSGPDGAGRKALVATLAATAGVATLRVRVAALPRSAGELAAVGAALMREAMLARAVLVLEGVDQAPPGVGPLDDALCPAYPGPIVATAGRITGRPPAMARGVVIIELGVPAETEREALWLRALRPAPAALARWAGERYAVTPGVIAQAGASAVARAAARAGDDAVTTADVHAGLRGVLDAKLATLGTRIAWRQGWDELVLPDDAAAEIREFIARIKHRRQVYEHWGFGRKVAKGMGLSALFAGPPGTGKTMVAGIIADELGLDLYQIDLSKVVSKWVGETEKNLGELFDAAEAGHAILLFDEADALFAKRTQVQTSNDRYANLEVNYLLQRMEAFAGIVILTTNHETAIDEAFRRRLSLKVDFPVPEADERARLWRALLPAEAEVAADIDVDALARRFEMTGGYIKNATVRAAFLAADEGGPIAMRHLVRAARAEYQAMGKVVSHL